MYPIGISTCGAPATEAMFAACREAGITHIELSYNKPACDELDLPAIKALADGQGITLWSFHLPFSQELDVSLTDDQARTSVVAYQSEFLRKVSSIGIKTFVIHPSSEPIDEEDRPARVARAKESLAILADLAVSLGVTLAVENLPRTCLGNCSDEMLELLFAHPALRSCFDTNHLLHENAAAYIRRVGDRIVTTHVSDYDFVNERHWLPGEGKQDFLAILKALSEVDYKGIWLHEFGMDTPKSITRSRELTYADVAENARSLFAGERPAPFGTPIPNLGMWA